MSLTADRDGPKPHFFRTVVAQVILVSCTAFCTIGSFNALQGLGGAGQALPYIANAGTAINFGLLGVVCILAGPIVTRLGVKWSLAIGTCGNPLFAAAVYCNTRFDNQWFFILASVWRGLCSGLFWAAEGSVIIGYPRANHRGRSITTWVIMKELGSVVSSSINLGISAHDNKGGHVGYAVYYVTIGIMCAALPLALLLSPAKKVRHRDGTPIKLDESATSYAEEYRQLLLIVRRTDVLLILPFAWFAYFYYSYSHTFITKHFSVRGRALTSLLTAISSMLGSALIAIFSDQKASRKQRRLVTLSVLVLLICAGTWTYFAYVSLSPLPRQKLDWNDPGFARLAVAVILIFMAMQAAQTYLYWTAGHLADSVNNKFNLAGVVRGIESLGQCVAYGVNSTHTVNAVSIGLNLGFFVIGSISLLILIFRVRGRID